MNDDDRSLTVLIQEMLDGVLDDDQRADLLKRVESDEAARRAVSRPDCHAHGAAGSAGRLPSTESGRAKSSRCRDAIDCRLKVQVARSCSDRFDGRNNRDAGVGHCLSPVAKSTDRPIGRTHHTLP